MNCSTPGLPVHRQLPEFTQTHVHWVGDAIQPTHPLSSPFLPAPNPSQCNAMNRSTLGLPVYHRLPEFTQTHVHWVGDAIQPSHPLLSPSLPTFNLSQHQGLFQWVSSLHQMAKVLMQSFSFSISNSNEYSGLISFRTNWLDLLAVQGTLKTLLQHHSSKASILQCSTFFIVQPSHWYLTTGKTIALTRWIFVGKVMSLLFNMLSQFLSWR